jgi:hypothetical protein
MVVLDLLLWKCEINEKINALIMFDTNVIFEYCLRFGDQFIKTNRMEIITTIMKYDNPTLLIF